MPQQGKDQARTQFEKPQSIFNVSTTLSDRREENKGTCLLEWIWESQSQKKAKIRKGSFEEGKDKTREKMIEKLHLRYFLEI